ncbi:MAG TPA: FAD-binding protein [Steroidobacteraceae bacterium]|jgi:FAD/FMN-containing dehydrogenase|nr:FAD-binding protein [Steroidobacteraceae bacterium]
MYRRRLLKSLASLPLAALPLAALLPRGLRAANGAAGRRRVGPADPDWPTAEAWRALNQAVGGNLLEVPPLLGACAAGTDSAGCREVLANLRNPFYLGDQPSGTQVSGWLDAWTPAASVYAVKARDTADVVAAVNFAREHRLRLAVKGGGHSYQGTSNARDSLLVWTRAMNRVTLHEAFVPQGCAGRMQPVPAVSSGAGAMWIDLYDAVTTRAGRYVQGGGCTSVGVAGLVQSGGFGSFSKGFGTAAAGLLEAEVVTADARALTVNACSHPELFWALKGGGGGSWGVVTRLTLRTLELPEFFGAAWGTIRARTDSAFRKLLARFFDFYASDLLNPHWGEQVTVGSDNSLKLSMVCQGLDPAQARAVWQPLFDWIAASPGEFTVTDELGAGAKPARRWWDSAGNRSMIPDLRPGAPSYHVWWNGDQDQVGAYLHAYDSLWLPAALLHGQQRQGLLAALFAASRHKSIGLHFNKGLAGAPAATIAATLATATNPEVTRAFALAIIADGGPPAYPGMPGASVDAAAARADARSIDAASAALRRLVRQAGSYVSESNFFNATWQRAFWGEHYARLRAVKASYDPQGLFIGHHGVGSEDWSADGFTRL